MADPDMIYNWQRMDTTITTSGRMTPADLDLLAALGVGCIVNLAPDGVRFAMADEAAEVAARGMAYVQIPVDFAAPAEADFARFCETLTAQADLPLHVHCIANWRVSAFFCRYRRDVLGWDDAAARAPMARIWQPDGVWANFLTPPPPSYPPAPTS